MTTIDFTQLHFENVIDVRDLIARVEELEGLSDEDISHDEVSELTALKYILKDLEGSGGDEQWRGDWYPLMLIRESYFRDYAQELAEDIGAVNRDAAWPNNCIDWNQAARELQMDYTSITINGVTYFFC